MFKKIVSNPQLPFWLIAFSALIVMTLPKLIQDGMFMDAMLYTSVAHNLSKGIGTFWFPVFDLHNIINLPSFHEHPPLVFAIQAVFFRVLGDSMYVERIYTFLTMCITGLIICLFWKRVYKNEKELQKLAWLPLIIWITIPVCFWSYSNNMQENTMGIFTAVSILLSLKYLQNPTDGFLKWIFPGILIFLATLCKGFPGFFPITVPFLYWLIIKKINFKKSLIYSLILILILIIIYVILFLIPTSRESLSIYLFKRAFLRMSNVPTVNSRFYILGQLFMEQLAQILFVIIVIMIARFKKVNLEITNHIRLSIFFITIGLSASIPLILTLVQKSFYFVPALPFFAIGFSILIAPIVANFIIRINIKTNQYKVFLITCVLSSIIIIIAFFMQIGKTSRDKEMLHDVYLIGHTVKNGSVISIPDNTMWDEWSLKCYLVRYCNINLENLKLENYYLLDKSIKPKENILLGYNKVNIKTLKYDLYKRK